MRGFLPIVAGAVVGALIATFLLRYENDNRSAVPADSLPLADFPALAERAGTDLDATPEELSGIADPVARRAAALALVANPGGASADFDQIAAFLAPDEVVSFRIHAIVNLGATDMPGAIAAAAALPEYEQRRLALLRLAPVLASSDPAGAIASIDAIGAPDLATEFAGALFDAWAKLDPAALFDYLGSSDASRVAVPESAFQGLAARDPERLLVMADEMQRGSATLATTAALAALVEQDPLATLTYIDALPPGSKYSQLRTQAVQAYAEQDPEAAWEWAEETQADGFTKLSVVRGIHQVDPDKAWDIMQSLWNSSNAEVRSPTREYVMNYVNTIVNSDSTEEITRGLDRLLSLGDPQIAAEMTTNLQAWATRDPEAALDWSLRNLDRINAASVLTALGSGLARTNPELARETVSRLEEQHRASWAAGVVRTLARTDLAAAEAWAFEFPSGTVRDAGLSEVIRGQAQGGTVDRQLFDLISNDTARGAAASGAARRFACDGQTALALELATTYITDRRLLESTRRSIVGDPNLPASSRSFECQFSQ